VLESLAMEKIRGGYKGEEKKQQAAPKKQTKGGKKKQGRALKGDDGEEKGD